MFTKHSVPLLELLLETVNSNYRNVPNLNHDFFKDEDELISLEQFKVAHEGLFDENGLFKLRKNASDELSEGIEIAHISETHGSNLYSEMPGSGLF